MSLRRRSASNRALDPTIHVRRLAARVFFVGAIAVQLFFVVRGYRDPHKHFAFQPFNESSTWRAEIYRVLAGGRRVSLRDGWAGYRWAEGACGSASRADLLPGEPRSRRLAGADAASGSLALGYAIRGSGVCELISVAGRELPSRR